MHIVPVRVYTTKETYILSKEPYILKCLAFNCVSRDSWCRMRRWKLSWMRLWVATKENVEYEVESWAPTSADNSTLHSQRMRAHSAAVEHAHSKPKPADSSAFHSQRLLQGFVVLGTFLFDIRDLPFWYYVLSFWYERLFFLILRTFLSDTREFLFWY